MHAILTHCDPDHVGGLADFPGCEVHVSEEEHASVAAGHFRYCPPQFAHDPKWRRYPKSEARWFGMEARPLNLGFAHRPFLFRYSGTRWDIAA